MDFENVEMKDIHPKDYLNKGFLSSNGELREGINGMYSLAIAYQCRAEGIGPEQIKTILDQLIQVGDDQFKGNNTGKQPLSPEAIAVFDRMKSSSEVQKSTSLSSLFDAARPWLKDWQSYGAFVLHLERIMGQLALVTTVSQH